MNNFFTYKIYCYYNGLAEGNYKNFKRFMEKENIQLSIKNT